MIEPAADWRERIERGIGAAKAVIFLLTPESVSSDECRRELDIAVAHHKLVVPVLLRDVERQWLPDVLSRPNWVLFRDSDDPDKALSQLVEALETDLEWRDAHARLAVRTAEWASSGRDQSFLLRGNDLRSAENWARQAAAHPRTPPTPLQVEYILASRKGADRVARTWRAALIAGLVVSVVLGGLALSKEIQASHEARVAESNALAANATVDLSADPQTSIGLALRSTRLNISGQTEQALRLALADGRMRMVLRSGAGAATVASWLPTGAELAVSARASVQLWDIKTGRLLQALPTTRRYPVSQLIFDPGGSYLAAISSSGYVWMWQASAGGRMTPVATAPLDSYVRSLAGPPAPYSGMEGVWDVWPGDHRASRWWAGGAEELDLYGASMPNVVRFDPVSGTVRPLFATPVPHGDAGQLAVSPDGSELFVIGAVGQVIDFAADRQWVIRLPADQMTGPPCWYPDGSLIATSSGIDAGGPVDLWLPRTGQLVAHIKTEVGKTTAVACSTGPANDWVATGDAQGDLVLRLPDGSALPLYGDSNEITGLASSPNGRYLAASSLDGSARVWDARTGRLLTVLAGDGAPLNGVGFDADGGLAFTVDSRGLVRVWDTDVGAPVVRFGAPVVGFAGPSGRATVALGFTDGGASVYGITYNYATRPSPGLSAVSMVRWASRTGRLVSLVALPGIRLSAVPCSGYLKQMLGLGSLLAAGGCRIPPPPDLTVAVPLPGPNPNDPTLGFEYVATLALSMSADGKYLAYAGADDVTVVRTGTKRVTTLPVGGAVSGLAFGPAGDRMVVMTENAIYLWTPFSARPALVIRQPSAPIDAVMSHNGRAPGHGRCGRDRGGVGRRGRAPPGYVAGAACPYGLVLQCRRHASGHERHRARCRRRRHRRPRLFLGREHASAVQDRRDRS